MATVTLPRKGRIHGSPPFPPPLLPMHRFSVAPYHRLIEAGILGSGDRAELLEGWIVAKRPKSPANATALTRLLRKLTQRLPEAYVVRPQCPITTRQSEPEPDVAVVRGPERRYVRRHPGPADIALVIEVADTSLAEEQEGKRPYRKRQDHGPANSLPRIVAGKGLGAIAVRQSLP